MPVSMKIRRIGVSQRSAKVAPWQVLSSATSSSSSKNCLAFLVTFGLSPRHIGLGLVRSPSRASQPKYTRKLRKCTAAYTADVPLLLGQDECAQVLGVYSSTSVGMPRA